MHTFPTRCTRFLYRKRPVSPTYPGGGWPTWLVEDQRFVDNRPDVLTWQTGPLQEDLKIAGDESPKFTPQRPGPIPIGRSS